MQRKSILLSLVCLAMGAWLGSWATWRTKFQTDGASQTSIGYSDEHPEQWLLPDGTTLEKLFGPELLAAIREPEVVRIHRMGDDGKIDVNGYRFSSVGVIPDSETRKRLNLGLTSLSSYRGVSACEFSPGVLLHLEKGGKFFDLLFCFNCRDIHCWRDGKRPEAEIGMSTEGADVFLKCFSDALPEFTELKTKRQKLQ